MGEWNRTDAMDLFLASVADSILGKMAGEKEVLV
jgi:hypothetical protein